MTKEEAIKILSNRDGFGIPKGYTSGYAEAIDIAIKSLKSLDESVAHGEWIKMDKRGNNVRCSKCGNTLDLRGVNAGRGDANHCPNCGADMRENIDEYTIEDFMFGQDLGNPEDGSL